MNLWKKEVFRKALFNIILSKVKSTFGKFYVLRLVNVLNVLLDVSYIHHQVF